MKVKIIFALLLISCLFTTSCANDKNLSYDSSERETLIESDSYETTDENADLLSIKNMDSVYFSVDEEDFESLIGIAQDELLESTYANEEISLFSLCKKSDEVIMEGPAVETKELIIVNHLEKEIQVRVMVPEGYYIFNAVPFEDGIIYSTMPWRPDERTEYKCWKVIFQSESEMKILKEGFNRGGYMGSYVPEFVVIKDSVFCLSENIDPEYTYELSQIYMSEAGVRCSTIFEENSGTKTLLNCLMYDNGKELIFPTINEDVLEFVVADESGVIKNIPIHKKIYGFGINKDYAFVCTVGTKLNLFSIHGDTEKAIPCGALYSVKMMGNKIIAMDGYHNYNFYEIDGDEVMRYQIVFDSVINSCAKNSRVVDENKLLMDVYLPNNVQKHYLCVMN